MPLPTTIARHDSGSAERCRKVGAAWPGNSGPPRSSDATRKAPATGLSGFRFSQVTAAQQPEAVRHQRDTVALRRDLGVCRTDRRYPVLEIIGLPSSERPPDTRAGWCRRSS
ncbi:hypothetical protein Aca07nite_04480 [Actinoplanes capillaceus]|uniref:Uncharacterized protein n=1 Tax=Actinoplanes campanulatus TaxID=113559 RepID=A0ABQ3WEM0_9ACTN|nr:hypothetical protein Aca07nite_04480 [Actinoplanes capillaceus]